MSRPDANSPDPDSSANPDDAVWLDLVARLEGPDQSAGAGAAAGVAGGAEKREATDGEASPEAKASTAGTDGTVSTDSTGAADGTVGSDGTIGTDTTAGTDGTAGAEGPSPAGRGAAHRPFSDFDPLGLSFGAPVELSAAERLAQSQAAASAAGGPDAAGGQAAPGPRDYEAADDDLSAPGEFVPEEPPSLAGTDPLTMLAWLGAVGGPVALLMSAMFWRSAPLLAVLGMVAAFAASLVFLIMKLPGEKDEHDDGARI